MVHERCYRETEYVRRILAGGFQSASYKYEACLLALYYRDVYGCTQGERKKLLETFFKNNIPGYTPTAYYKTIRYAISESKRKKNVLIDVESLPIYKNEIEYIDNLFVTNDTKKLLFSFLVRLKLNAEVNRQRTGEYELRLYFSGGSGDYRRMRDYADIKVPNINKTIIADLANKGLVRVLYNGMIYFTCFEDMGEQSELAFEVKHLFSAGLYYEWYHDHDHYRLCAECEKPFKVSRSCILYCPDHSGGYSKKFSEQEDVYQCTKCKGMFMASNFHKRVDLCDKCYIIYRRKQNIEAVERRRRRMQENQ